MKLDASKQILIVGLGLLGGSYAMALKKKGYSISAITKDAASVAYALENHIIDRGTTEVNAEWIAQADLIVFALYPYIFVEWIREHGHLIQEGTVITDVTGTTR